MASEMVMRDAGALDLRTPPWTQWHADMVKLVKQSTGLRKAATDAEVYYCLALAESLQLNPLAGEIFFIPRKARDGEPTGVQPYVGRDGLVKKATQRRAWFEAETVRENDEFQVVRRQNGTRAVTHKFGHHRERGEIVGAWAMLHFPDGSRSAFSYAPLEEFLPTFDAEWKMKVSPWGNQRSGMIEKCAMIMAGRQRLPLGGVLMDAELPRVLEQDSRTGEITAGEGFDWGSLNAPAEIVAELRALIDRANELQPLSWTPAKCEMLMSGRSAEELHQLARQIGAEVEILAAAHGVSAPDGRSEGQAGGGTGAPAPSGSEAEVVDALVVAPDEERADGLRLRIARLEESLKETDDPDAVSQLEEEIAQVGRELAALGNPDQTALL